MRIHRPLTARRPPVSAAGFTLLEAIVAVAIIGLALIPLVSFLSLSANELSTAAETNERSFVTQAVVALMDPINPAVEPSGSIALNDKVTINWDSQQLVAPSKQIVPGSGLPTTRLSFYKVHVVVSRPVSGDWFDFDMRKVGYEAVPFDVTSPGIQ